MKNLIKTLIIIAVLVVAVSATTIVASASSFTVQANSLKEMGLFIGTEKGFELDRAPTRAEAAVMLVRLLGKESEAAKGTYSHTFQDVPAWAEKYVGYLYISGLTKGTSATTFSPEQSCDLQMYSTFLLRSLGYTEDNGTFTYSEAQDFAQDIGLIDSSTISSSFLRDDVAGLSYSALFQKTKSSNATLLDNLASQNAVTKATADKYKASYDLYENYLSAIKNANQISTEVQANTTLDATAMGTTIRMLQDSTAKTVLNNNKITAEVDSTMSFMGNSYQSYSYYSNGWLYSNSDGEKFKIPFPIDNIADLSSINSSNNPFYLINSISKSNTESGTVYTISYAIDAAENIIDSSLSSFKDSIIGTDIKVNALLITATIGSDGKLKSQTISADITTKTSANGQDYEIRMSMNSVVTVIRTGDTVKITLPADLDSYTDLTA